MSRKEVRQESVDLLVEIMKLADVKSPELAAKQARLLKILQGGVQLESDSAADKAKSREEG